MSQSHDDHEHGPQFYTKILITLMILAAVSWVGPIVGPLMGPALGVPEGAIKVFVFLTAFGIAVVKAWMVIKHFMHLNIEKKYVNYMLITALGFMVLFFAGTAPDVMNHRGRQWENVAAQSEVQRALKAASEGGAHHGDHAGGHSDDHAHEGEGHSGH